MKVLNISRYLPVDGFPPVNDITLKIYADLARTYPTESRFILPLSHIPKWATYLKKSLKRRYDIIQNKAYVDKTYNIPIHFYQAYFGLQPKLFGYRLFKNIKQHFSFYKNDLYNQVETFKPDIVHAHTVEDAFYAYKIFLKFDTPYIVTLRGFYHELYKSKQINKVLNNAKKIVTPSAKLKLDLDNLYAIELLPHGIDQEWFKKGEKKFKSSPLQIITVASLIEMKNIQLIIKSISQMVSEGYRINYSIVGKGPYEKQLKKLVAENNIEGSITFHGFLTSEKIRELYNKKDIFIMLSYPETFGRVYFEAAAQGLLIIGRKGTGIDGYLGKEAAFTVANNKDEVVNTLKKIDDKLFYEMTCNSQKKMQEFKNEYIVNRYYELLQTYSEN